MTTNHHQQRTINSRKNGRGQRPAFYSVAEAASLLAMSHMTLRRAIADGEFPAVRIRGRIIVPVRAVEELTERALGDGCMITAATITARA